MFKYVNVTCDIASLCLPVNSQNFSEEQDPNKSDQSNLGTGPHRSTKLPPGQFYNDGSKFIFGPQQILYSNVVATGGQRVYYAAANADRHTPWSASCSLYAWPRCRTVLKIGQAASWLRRHGKLYSKNRGTKTPKTSRHDPRVIHQCLG